MLRGTSRRREFPVIVRRRYVSRARVRAGNLAQDNIRIYRKA